MLVAKFVLVKFILYIEGLPHTLVNLNVFKNSDLLKKSLFCTIQAS